MEVNFERFLERFLPRLKAVARRVNGHLRFTAHLCGGARFIDEDDLIQVMSLHLWEKWKEDDLEGKTDSFILKGCWFQLKNYLRTVNGKAEVISLDELINSEGTTLRRTVPDNSRSLDELVDGKMLVEKIRANGLTEREREVFNLYLEGYNLREIGEKLEISSARVAKVQENIRQKWTNKVNGG
jgi:RNA polymerase sigma factor (sigma-70 family)